LCGDLSGADCRTGPIEHGRTAAPSQRPCDVITAGALAELVALTMLMLEALRKVIARRRERARVPGTAQAVPATAADIGYR
jgi:hypothetical protein